MRSAVVQAVVGASQSCLDSSAFCLTLATSVVDSCISTLGLSSSVGSAAHVRSSSSEKFDVGQRQTSRARPCRGPAGRLLQLGYGISGAGCGIAQGLYKAFI